MPTHSPSTTASTDLMLLLSKARHALATEHAATLAEIGLSSRAYCVLCHASRGEFTQIQLAERCDLDKTTMVVTVDELERAGLAHRQPVPTDRRARIVVVTEAGRRKVEQGKELVDRVHAEVLSALPEAERTAFLRGLERLVDGRLAQPVMGEGAVRRPRDPRAAGG
jgi:MarR family transcriptional regulator, transcriptional regulator for hemolysin